MGETDSRSGCASRIDPALPRVEREKARGDDAYFPTAKRLTVFFVVSSSFSRSTVTFDMR
jgi:hypothetical protein